MPTENTYICPNCGRTWETFGENAVCEPCGHPAEIVEGIELTVQDHLEVAAWIAPLRHIGFSAALLLDKPFSPEVVAVFLPRAITFDFALWRYGNAICLDDMTTGEQVNFADVAEACGHIEATLGGEGSRRSLMTPQ